MYLKSPPDGDIINIMHLNYWFSKSYLLNKCLLTLNFKIMFYM